MCKARLRDGEGKTARYAPIALRCEKAARTLRGEEKSEEQKGMGKKKRKADDRVTSDGCGARLLLLHLSVDLVATIISGCKANAYIVGARGH